MISTPRIAITTGEPAGIGPDLVLSIAQEAFAAELVILADPQLLLERGERLGLPCQFSPYTPDRTPLSGAVSVLPVDLAAPCRPGVLDPRNAEPVLDMLRRACQGCLSGEFAAMVTAPVQKSIINESGRSFSGHTEFLAQESGAEQPVMLLVSDRLRVALATTHLALADVPAAITAAGLTATLKVLHRGLRERFGLDEPRIAVLGLNPHAGESGHLGREEIELIEPVLAELRAAGLSLRGPLPADTAFTPGALAACDAVLAMYHDQGLPVLKYAGFGAAVNVTLGLPFIRTSVDHGTALDLAGSGSADPGSLRSAVALAIHMAGLAAATEKPVDARP